VIQFEQGLIFGFSHIIAASVVSGGLDYVHFFTRSTIVLLCTSFHGRCST